MEDHDEVAVAARVPAGEDHGSATGRVHGRARGRGEVEAGVEAVAPWPKAVSDGRADRGHEPDRGPADRASQRGDRARPGDAVCRQARPRLEPLDGGYQV